MKSIFFSIIFLPSLAFALIFESGELRCAGDDNGNNMITGLAYCEEGSVKIYGQMKNNLFEGLSYIDFGKGYSVSLVEYKNDFMEGIGLQIYRDDDLNTRLIWGQQAGFYTSGWNVEVENIFAEKIEFYLSFFEQGKLISSYPTINIRPVEQGIMAKFLFHDTLTNNVCKQNTFVGSFFLEHGSLFNNRTGYLGKVDGNCVYNGPVIQFENGKIIKYAIFSDNKISKNLTEEEFSKEFGDVFNDFNNTLTVRHKNIIDFGEELLNFAKEAKKIGIENLKDDYFLFSAEEQVNQKFSKYINEFNE